jgi:hypothetical protein
LGCPELNDELAEPVKKCCQHVCLPGVHHCTIYIIPFLI